MQFPAHPDIKSAFIDLLLTEGGANFELHLKDIYPRLANNFNLTASELAATYAEVVGEGSNTENYWQNAVRTAKARLIDEGKLHPRLGNGLCRLTPSAISMTGGQSSRQSGNTQQYSTNTRTTTQSSTTDALIAATEQDLTNRKAFDPTNIQDGRERVIASVVQRRGQPHFRRELLRIYGGKCAISEVDAEQALEAAHIIPYKGDDTNNPTNGLLLRADLHTLFDLKLVAIDTSTMTVVISPKLMNTTYRSLVGKPLHVPQNESDQPNRGALDAHRSEAGL
jgi:hypothetical protein